MNSEYSMALALCRIHNIIVYLIFCYYLKRLIYARINLRKILQTLVNLTNISSAENIKLTNLKDKFWQNTYILLIRVNKCRFEISQKWSFLGGFWPLDFIRKYFLCTIKLCKEWVKSKQLFFSKQHYIVFI